MLLSVPPALRELSQKSRNNVDISAAAVPKGFRLRPVSQGFRLRPVSLFTERKEDFLRSWIWVISVCARSSLLSF